MSAIDELLEQAMRLEAGDRAALAHRLLDTLDETAPRLTREEWRSAWGAEIDRRIEAYERGEIGASTADESIAYARSKLREGRE